MGCCMSTSDASAPQKRPHSSVGAQRPGSNTSHVRGSNCKAPPPLMEEETVKEVLSETPTPKPAITKVEEEKKTPKPVFQKIEEEEKIEKEAPVSVAEEISEVSEIYSVSESVSTTITERREDDERSRDDGEVRQRVDRSPAKFTRHRSFSGDLSGKRERVVGRSPARRSEPSPGRRNDGVVRSVHGREGSQTTVRRSLRTDGHRRDSGESSGRRSRSPATRMDSGATRSTLGRMPSSRRTGRSPGRVPAVPPDSSRKVEENREGKWPPTNESLENPLVSLECFIFL